MPVNDTTLLPLGVMADTGERLATIDDETLDLFSNEHPETQVSSDAIDAKKDRAADHLGTDDDVRDPGNLQEVGWAVMFAAGVGDDIKKQLQPLIEHRRKEWAT